MQIDISLPQALSLKIGASTLSRNPYPTARLQKGFILIDHGHELTEEAVGFGVPVLQKGLQTIFPGAVNLSFMKNGSTCHVEALFTLDLVEKVSRQGKKTLENKLMYAGKNMAAAAIRRIPWSRGALTTASTQLRRWFHLETTYAPAGFSIPLAVHYAVDTQTGTMDVSMNLENLPPEINAVMLMNEQGGNFFDGYRDSSGITLAGKEIGCWDEVSAEAARFESLASHVAFSLRRIKGAKLFRGREMVGSRLAWAGFGYQLSPSISEFQYRLSIERLA